MKMKQKNDFNGANFNGSTQIGEQRTTIQGDQYNVNQYNNYANNQLDNEKTKVYTVEPKWRSPFTMGVLTWISVFLGIAGIIPLGALISNILNTFNSPIQINNNEWYNLILFVLFLLCLFICLIAIKLREITSKQIRLPLFHNYAINGKGYILTLEKIKPNLCPFCGGRMKYYNKPTKWIDFRYPNGKLKKRKVTERTPAVECIRNENHCYEIDPAEDKV